MTARDALRRSSRVVILALALTFAFATGSALAANFTVTTTADGNDGFCSVDICTLRDAVIAANAAPGSTINLPAGTYKLTIGPAGNDDATTGDLNITAATTIAGAGQTTTVIDGGGGDVNTVTDRVFRVESGGVLELSNATIEHGHPAGGSAFPLSEGGGILALGALKLTDATVQNNFVETPGDQHSGGGAGISQGASASLALTRVDVLENQVIAASGKIGGGGGLMLAGGSPGSVSIVDSTIADNTAAGPGGGIYSNPIADGGSITITGTTLSGNRAALPPGLSNSNHAFGGGLATDGALPVSLSQDIISSNVADQTGGGIFDNGASTYTIQDTSIVQNAAVAGCTNCGVDFLGGGGIAADGGTRNPGWTLTGDFISANSAGDANHPGVPGGGIDEDGGDTFTVVNTTIFGNTATGIGGGYESSGGGDHTLTNDTIDQNRAGSGGGSIDNSGGGTFTFANTIIARGTPVNCGTATGNTSLGHNLESTDTCGIGATGDLTNADPKLGFPGPNGGPTLTEALPISSPAVDAGDNARCPNTDQRGVPRSENAVCDIGAFEFQHSLTVTNNDDSGPGSLRDAIAASDSGTTIVFGPTLNGQTIRLTAGLSIVHSLTISGPGASQLTIDGNNNVTLFDIEADENADSVTISGLTLTRGAFSSSGSSGGGGAIFADTLHDLTLNGDTITGNSATVDNANHGGGGGVYANGNTLTITNSTISGNDVTITNAHGSGHGGGGIFSNAGTTVVSGSVVNGNSVTQSTTSGSGTDGGGGIYDRGGDLTLTNSHVENNSDTVDTGGLDGGGGVFEDGDTLTITGSTINVNDFTLANSNNGTNGGGAVYNDGGDVLITSSSINGNGFTLSNSNSGVNGGGGVYDDGGGVLVTSSSIVGNAANITDTGAGEAADGGAGLYSNGGQLTIAASTIADNAGSVTATSGSNGGGAVYDQGINTTYLNSTLSGNSITIASSGQQNGGGAIYGFGNAQGHVSISDTTIAGNTTNEAGGAIFDQADTYAFKNTIVSGNSGSPAGDCAGAGPFNSAGNNLSSATGCGFTQSSDLTNADPKLGPLQDNGGPTPTRALPTGSPAVDAGACTDVAGAPVTTDQRGTARPQPAGGKCDIGAFELAESGTQQQQPPPHQSAPATQTTAPATKSSTGATLAGSVNPEGQATTYFFQYGLDPRLRPPGASTALYDQSTAPQSLPADTSTHVVSALISNLVPNALYHFRLVASNATGTTPGPDQTFTTPTGPAPPPPALGKSENVDPVSGHVFVLIAGKLVPLTQERNLPSGTTIDARRGSLELTAASTKAHQHLTGVFGGAIFKVTQSRANQGLTTLSLVEGAFKGAPTYASCRAGRATDPAGHAALSSRVLQSLRSRASGRFRTRGRYAAGTVRGTAWTTTDRCDGTLIAVQLHSVLVTDLVKHITVLVRAGHHYLARPRK